MQKFLKISCSSKEPFKKGFYEDQDSKTVNTFETMTHETFSSIEKLFTKIVFTHLPLNKKIAFFISL